MNSKEQTLERLLVVWVGEEVVSLQPALQSLQQTLPQVAIALLSPINTHIAPLLPLSQALHYTTSWQALGAHQQLIQTLKGSFEAAIIFTQRSYSPYPLAYLCYLAGIPIRIGLSQEFGGGVLSHWIQPPADNLSPAERHFYLLQSGLPILLSPTHAATTNSHLACTR